MTRISLVLSGGASLGAYVGGALTELLVALERNRRDEPVTIDVISASSAGALSAALAARSLMVNPSLVPWIERTWVDALGADLLLNPHRAERSALLDAEAVDELTRPLIAGDPAADDRASPAAAGTLHVGFTLTRLDDGRGGASGAAGADAPDRRDRGPAAEDEVVFRLTPRKGAGNPVWEKIRSAALAAGAVPLVFAPRRLFLDGPDDAGELAGPGSEGAWYADGSVAGDRPLALADRMAGAAGGGERLRLLIDPTGAGGEDGNAGAPPGTGRVVGLIARGTLGRGAARELLRGEGGSGSPRDRGDLFRALVTRLPEINAALDDPEAVGLGRRIGELAERVAERQVARTGSASPASSDPALERLDAELTRIRETPLYSATLERATTRAGRTRLGKLIYVLEAIGRPPGGGDAELRIVTPSGELAGDFMGGFGGYLSESCRRHDFRAGRRDARELLGNGLADRVAYDPDPEEAYEPGEAPGSFGELPAAARRKLRSFLEAEAGRLFTRLRPRGVGGLFYRISGRALRKAAARRAIDALREMP